MKNNLLQYKPFFTFLTKFLLFYVVFTFIYKMYLDQYDVTKNEVDFFTEIVAKQTENLLGIFTESKASLPHDKEPSVKLFYKDRFIARIIEGCNAISVIILYAAFIFAFSSQWKKTTLYIILGVLLIHILNIIRIALLVVLLYYYPQHGEILHGTFFPLFIYGVVFLLWILWVTKFSGYVKRTS
ncbi:exosortase family protein XrtF [Flavobacterium ardleyense]|uniref:Exosortase family protein XrtF n=1 Tax=Flavobacterium ardleyense TaxID=2038737 RepID=A0ABW5ZBZ9_9FLAO